MDVPPENEFKVASSYIVHFLMSLIAAEGW